MDSYQEGCALHQDSNEEPVIAMPGRKKEAPEPVSAEASRGRVRKRLRE